MICSRCIVEISPSENIAPQNDMAMKKASRIFVFNWTRLHFHLTRISSLWNTLNEMKKTIRSTTRIAAPKKSI